MRSLHIPGAPYWADRLPLGALMIAVLLGCPAWTPTPPMSVERGEHTATLLPDGRVLVAGGRDGEAFEPDDIWNIAEVYDPVTGAWSMAAPMLTARFNHAAALLADGRVLVAGGRGADLEDLASTEIYDPAIDAWSPAAPMGSAAGVWITVTPLLDGRALAVYGDHAEIYDAPTNTWSPTAAPLQARWGFTATRLLDGRVLLTGGHPDPDLTQVPDLASAEIYDPEAGIFEPAGAMIGGREHHTAVLLPDGRVFIAGGASDLTLLATTELYDPITNTFQSAPPMAIPRLRIAAAALPNGEVLVTGGDVPFLIGYEAIDSVERYDSVAGVWQPASAMLSTRSGHTLTPLLDGNALAAGGFHGSSVTDGFGYHDSAETTGDCLPVDPTTGAGGSAASSSSSATGAASGSGGSSSATGAASGGGGHTPPASGGGLGCTIRPAAPSTLSPFGLAASVLLLVARRRRLRRA